MLTQWWFLVNTAFVGLFIAFLFAQRSYKEAAQSGNADLARRRRAARTAVGVLALLAFAGMSALFAANMAING